MSNPVLRLYVLGSLDQGKNRRALTTFAEYENSRALSRVDLKKSDVEDLRASVGSLRAFIECQDPVIDSKGLKDIGSRLFNLLITGRTKDLFLLASKETRGGGNTLPLEIVGEDFEIAGWPWEYLFNPDDRKFIAQDFHPVSRNIFSMASRTPLRSMKGQPRVLVVLGVPSDDTDTTPMDELKVITEVFRSRLGNSTFSPEVLPASSFQRIQRGIGREYDVVHYFGHAGFDPKQGQGYLSIDDLRGNALRVYATNFANLLINSGVRLVFLNACKTAQGAPGEIPGRSSIAAALLDAGVPAVIGAQFSIPDVSAHFLSANVYEGLLSGKSVSESVRVGRNAMFFTDESKFFEWGIPVLYTTDPSQVLFPSEVTNGKEPSQKQDSSRVNNSAYAVATSPEETRRRRARNADTVSRNARHKRTSVALLDIDSKVGFLADLVRLINPAQDYYDFTVAYASISSSYVRNDYEDEPQTYVPRLKKPLLSLRKRLHVDYLCGITKNTLAGEDDDGEFSNYFTSEVKVDSGAFLVSTCDLRDYSRAAKVPFAKAVFELCLAMLVVLDPHSDAEYHKKTVGCMFDECSIRKHVIKGLRKRRFDHKTCRDTIGDPVQLAAIDSLFELDFSNIH
jgi:hypothetical protein